MKIKIGTRVGSFLLALFIVLGTVPSFRAADGQDPAIADRPADAGTAEPGGDGPGGAKEDEGGAGDSGAPGDADNPGNLSGQPGQGGDGDGSLEQPGQGSGAEEIPGETGTDDNEDDNDADDDSDSDDENPDGEGGTGGSSGGEGGQGEAGARRRVTAFADWDGLRITVSFGTPETAIGLPDTLEVEYAVETGDGEETGSETLAVDWRCDGYDPLAAGSYRFAAVLPAGWELAEGLRAPQAEVVVLEETPAALRVITRFPDFAGETPEIVAATGTPYEELALPATLAAAYLEDGGEPDGIDNGPDAAPAGAGERTGHVGVRWVLLEDAYDPDLLPATWHFRAELDEAGWALADGVEPPVLAVVMRAGVAMARANGNLIEVWVGDAKVYFCDASNNDPLNNAVKEANTYVNAEIRFLKGGEYTLKEVISENMKLTGEGADGEVRVELSEDNDAIDSQARNLIIEEITLVIDKGYYWVNTNMKFEGSTKFQFVGAGPSTRSFFNASYVFGAGSKLYTNGQIFTTSLVVQDDAWLIYTGDELEAGNLDTALIMFPSGGGDLALDGKLIFDIEFDVDEKGFAVEKVVLLESFKSNNNNLTKEYLNSVADNMALSDNFHEALSLQGDELRDTNGDLHNVIWTYMSGVKVEYDDENGVKREKKFPAFDGGSETDEYAVAFVNSLHEDVTNIDISLYTSFTGVKELPEKDFTLTTHADVLKDGDPQSLTFVNDIELRSDVVLKSVELKPGGAGKISLTHTEAGTASDHTLTVEDGVALNGAPIAGGDDSVLVVNATDDLETGKVEVGAMNLGVGASMIVQDGVEVEGKLSLENDSTVTTSRASVGALASNGGALAYPSSAPANDTSPILVINEFSNSADKTYAVGTLNIDASDSNYSFRNGTAIISVPDKGTLDADSVVRLQPESTFYKFMLDKDDNDETRYVLHSVTASVRYGDDYSYDGVAKYRSFGDAVQEAGDGAVINLWESAGTPENAFTGLPGKDTTIVGYPLEWLADATAYTPPGNLDDSRNKLIVDSGSDLLLQAATTFEYVELDLSAGSKKISAGSHTLAFGEGAVFAGNAADYTLEGQDAGGLSIRNNSALTVSSVAGFRTIELNAGELVVTGSFAGASNPGADLILNGDSAITAPRIGKLRGITTAGADNRLIFTEVRDDGNLGFVSVPSNAAFTVGVENNAGPAINNRFLQYEKNANIAVNHDNFSFGTTYPDPEELVLRREKGSNTDPNHDYLVLSQAVDHLDIDVYDAGEYNDPLATHAGVNKLPYGQDIVVEVSLMPKNGSAPLADRQGDTVSLTITDKDRAYPVTIRNQEVDSRGIAVFRIAWNDDRLLYERLNAGEYELSAEYHEENKKGSAAFEVEPLELKVGYDPSVLLARADERVYDGTLALPAEVDQALIDANLFVVDDSPVKPGDGSFSVIGAEFAFQTPYAGTGKLVNISHPKLGNNTLSHNYVVKPNGVDEQNEPTWTASAASGMAIGKRPLTVSLSGTATKVYDGGDNISLTSTDTNLSLSYNNLIPDDQGRVKAAIQAAHFAEENAGNWNIVVTDWEPTDFDMGWVDPYPSHTAPYTDFAAYFDANYSYDPSVAVGGATGTITRKPLTVTGTVSIPADRYKEYDGKPAVQDGYAFAASVDGTVGAESITLTPKPETAYYADSQTSTGVSNANADIYGNLFFVDEQSSMPVPEYGAKVTFALTAEPGTLLSNYTLDGQDIPATAEIERYFGEDKVHGGIKQIDVPLADEQVRVSVSYYKLGQEQSELLSSLISYQSLGDERAPGVLAYKAVDSTVDDTAFFETGGFVVDEYHLKYTARTGLDKADSTTAEIEIRSTNYVSKTAEVEFVVTSDVEVDDLEPLFDDDRVTLVYGELGETYELPTTTQYELPSGQVIPMHLSYAYPGQPEDFAPRDVGEYEAQAQAQSDKMTNEDGDDFYYVATYTFEIVIEAKPVWVSTNPDIVLDDLTVGDPLDDRWSDAGGFAFWNRRADSGGETYERIAPGEALAYDDTVGTLFGSGQWPRALNLQENISPHTDRAGRQTLYPDFSTLTLSHNYRVEAVRAPANNSVLDVAPLVIEEPESWLVFTPRNPANPNAAGWHNDVVEVKVASDAPNARFAFVAVSTDKNAAPASLQFAPSLQLGEEGVRELYFFLSTAVDGGAVSEPYHYGTFKLDMTDPAVVDKSFLQDGLTTGTVRVEVRDPRSTAFPDAEMSGIEEVRLLHAGLGPDGVAMRRVEDNVYQAEIDMDALGEAHGTAFPLGIRVRDRADNEGVDSIEVIFYDPDEYFEDEDFTLTLEAGGSVDGKSILVRKGDAPTRLRAQVKFDENLPVADIPGLRFAWKLEDGLYPVEMRALDEDMSGHTRYEVREFEIAPAFFDSVELYDSAELQVVYMGVTRSASFQFITALEPTDPGDGDDDDDDDKDVPAVVYPPGNRELLLLILPMEDREAMEGYLAELPLLEAYPNWRTDSRWMEILLVYRDAYEAGVIEQAPVEGSITIRLPLPDGVSFEEHNLLLLHLLDETQLQMVPLRSLNDGSAYEFTVTALSPFTLAWQEKDGTVDPPGPGPGPGGSGGSRRGGNGGASGGNSYWLYDDFWNQVIRAIRSTEPGGSVRADLPADLRTMPATVLEALRGGEVMLYLNWAGDPFCIWGENVTYIPSDYIFFYLEDLIGLYSCAALTQAPAEEPPAENLSLDNPNMGGDDIDIFNAAGQRVASLSAVSPAARALVRVDTLLREAGVPRPEQPDLQAMQEPGNQMRGGAAGPRRWTTSSVLLVTALFAAVIWLRHGRPEAAVTAAALAGTATVQLPAEPPLPLSAEDAGRSERIAAEPPAAPEPVSSDPAPAVPAPQPTPAPAAVPFALAAEPTPAPPEMIAPAQPRPAPSLLGGLDARSQRSREDENFYNIIEGHKLLDQQLRDGILTLEECRLLKRRLTILF